VCCLCDDTTSEAAIAMLYKNEPCVVFQCIGENHVLEVAGEARKTDVTRVLE